MKKNSLLAVGCAALMALAPLGAARAEEAPLVNIKRLSMEMALKAAQAAVAQCRKDVLAADLTLTISRQKAYTALSFNNATSAMEKRFTAPFSVGKVEGLVFSAGGLPITAGGTIVGGIGVSGAPSGLTDEKCARAGVDAITADLEMAAF